MSLCSNPVPRGVCHESCAVGGMNTERQPTTFIAFNRSVSLISALVPIAGVLRSHDRDLEKQLRKAASSIALNLGEGRKRTGRDRLHFWRIASGSAEETRVCLLVAVAWGYLEEDKVSDALALLDEILAMCWRLTH